MMKKTHGDSILLLPTGYFSQGGIQWEVATNADGVLLATMLRTARRDDFVVDYDHASMDCERAGALAPAAGWINPGTLQWRPDQGLFGVVEWTQRAKVNDYQAIVPCFSTKHGGMVKDIILWGLTNDPKKLLIPAPAALRIEREWENNAALRAEFQDFECFAALRRAEDRGLWCGAVKSGWRV